MSPGYIFLTIFLANVYWQNDYDERLKFECPNKQAVQRIRSMYNNYFKDRRWRLDCGTVTNTLYSYCAWTDYLNRFDEPLNYNCPTDQVLIGAKSYHNNWFEDRRWGFRCCKANGYKTSNCYQTGYINEWDAEMDFGVTGNRAFVGLYSYHSNQYE